MPVKVTTASRFSRLTSALLTPPTLDNDLRKGQGDHSCARCGPLPDTPASPSVRGAGHFAGAFRIISARVGSTALVQWLLMYARTAQISSSDSVFRNAGMSLS